jgi:hypothetical protein
MRLAAVAAAALLLSACSETAGPSLRSDPPDGATGVPLDAAVSIAIPEDVDAASVDVATVAFTRHDAYGPGTLGFTRSFDPATRTLRLEPIEAMKAGLVHEVRVEGLLADGEATSLGLAFTTLRNPWSVYEGDGERIEVEHDRDGWWVEVRYYATDDLGGALLTWEETSTWNRARTAEAVTGRSGADVQTWRTRYDGYGFPTDCETRCGSWETGCGPGGVDHLTLWLRDGSGRIVTTTRVEEGPDGAWRTDDDAWVDPLFSEYAADGAWLRDVKAFGPGADGQWGTADDLVSYALVATGGGRDRVLSGADGRLGTADDVTEYRDVYARNSDGTTATTVRYGGPGSDGTWGTSDDTIASVYTHAYDGHGARSEVLRSDGPGIDATWGTEDDAVAQRWTYRTDR